MRMVKRVTIEVELELSEFVRAEHVLILQDGLCEGIKVFLDPGLLDGLGVPGRLERVRVLSRSWEDVPVRVFGYG